MRAENRAIAAVLIAYAAVVFVLAGDYLDVVATVGAIDPHLATSREPVFSIRLSSVLAVVAGGLCWLFRDTPVDRELRFVWLVAVAALLAVTLLQGGGWTVPDYAACACALFLVALVASSWLEKPEALAEVFRPPAALLPLLGMLLLCGYSAVSMARASLAAVPEVSLVAENAEKLPYRDDYFDIVTSVYLLHELPRRVRHGVIEEMHRVLRPGGALVIELINLYQGLILGLLRKRFGTNLGFNAPGDA